MEAIILDTDIDTDCDDVGALCLLAALARQGKANLLGVIASVHCPPATGRNVRDILDAAGMGRIPVGVNRHHPEPAAYRAWKETQLERCYTGKLRPGNSGRDCFREAGSLYRELLRQAADRSVVICAIGFLTELAALLEAGEAPLIARKVKRLVTMAEPDWRSGREAFNWSRNAPAASRVLAEWPTEIVLSRLGGEVLTGAALTALPPDNPERIAYRIWNRGVEPVARPSWDQIAVLGAAGILEEHGWVERSCYGRMTMDPESGECRRVYTGEGKHCEWLPAETFDCGRLEAVIEHGMIALWQ